MKLLRSLLVVGAAAAIPLVPTAAQANQYTYADHTGDVVQFSSTSTTATPAPDRVVGDIASSTVKHRRSNVLMRITYRDLAANTELNDHVYFIRTPKMRRMVTMVAGDGFRGGKVFFTTPQGKKVRCSIGHKIDYAANTATVVVPRSCLGRPKWVKVGMAAIDITDLSASGVQYVDDARTAGGLGSTGPKYGPRVYR